MLALVPLLLCLGAQSKGIEVLTAANRFKSEILGVAVSPSGRYVAGVSRDRLEELDLKEGTYLGFKAETTASVFYLGDALYLGDSDGTIETLDRPGKKFTDKANVRAIPVNPAFAAGGSRLFYAIPGEKFWEVAGFEMKTGKTPLHLERRGSQGIFGVSPDGAAVVTVAEGPKDASGLQHFRLETHAIASNVTATLQDFTFRTVSKDVMEGAFFTSCAYSTSGTDILATWNTIAKDASGDAYLATYDAKTGKQKVKWTLKDGNVDTAIYLGDDRRIALVNSDKLVVYDLQAGKELASVPVDQSSEYFVAASKSGDVLAVGCGKVVTIYKITAKP
ncbi:MAG TPA: hypothetical protein VG820_04435 [Fimbriimonadaceae bacterium]|nr:hypothetical protein [Fimbriimonadaceae bacterium]